MKKIVLFFSAAVIVTFAAINLSLALRSATSNDASVSLKHIISLGQNETGGNNGCSQLINRFDDANSDWIVISYGCERGGSSSNCRVGDIIVINSLGYEEDSTSTIPCPY